VRPYLLAAACLILGLPASASAEDGYQLWLRYPRLEGARAAAVQLHATGISGRSASLTLAAARQELARGVRGFLGHPVPSTATAERGGVLLGTPTTSRLVARLLPRTVDRDAYFIRSVRSGGQPVTVIGARTDLGVLYGVFAFLRTIQTDQPIDRLNIVDTPRLPLRMLDHWDNPDGSVERGYAGRSLWEWSTLPTLKQARYTDYARANASIGINGTVLNNVNADAAVLAPSSLRKVRALANLFRPWGIRV
jgi:alpha-glucuronidase